MITWIKNNYFIALFFVLSLSFISLFSLSQAVQGDEEKVITIQQGDNLWNLANKHASNQPKSDWTDTVIHLNQLQDSNIKAGQVLKVPGEKDYDDYPLIKNTEIAGSEQ